ncbi:hypothetical protein BPMI_00577c [Candidatus Burkholderia pumila]|uniref:Chromosome segregation ATPase n=1 Tax=Candidatus Burkholderia pumila TaxID=1090375 RepID=A0ABR5HJX2_9BURK|nr:hypothetical protein BPMI_00577c [Candidatus Burkholderia pumila]
MLSKILVLELTWVLLFDRMSDRAGPSLPPYDPIGPTRLVSPRLYYPVELSRPLTYRDFENGVMRVCDPLTAPPCFCPSRDMYPYPVWVVHQLERERTDLAYMATGERREREYIVDEYHRLFHAQDRIIDEVEAKLAATTQQLTGVTQQLTAATEQVTAQAQEIERLRQRLQHQEARLQRAREDLEPTIEISSSTGHAEPQGSGYSVNQSDASSADQPGQQGDGGALGHSDSEPSEGFWA